MSLSIENPKAVLNQPPPLRGYNMYETNVPLVEALKREGAAWADERCRQIGDDLDGELDELGRVANENPPKLKTHDRYGNRIDEVEFHPAWHELMRRAIGSAAHSLPWIESRPGGHTARERPDPGRTPACPPPSECRGWSRSRAACGCCAVA